MVFLRNLVLSILVALVGLSCAPVKFSKSESKQVGADCSGVSCSQSANSISCNPQINGTVTTFTYSSGAALPSINSNCSPSDVDYIWTVKKADASVVSVAIPGLLGMNPTGINFTGLGQGVYYVYLTATKTGSGYANYNSSNPLEFIVPGSSVGNSLTCDPKLNGTMMAVNLSPSDANPTVSANCVPAAGTYTWTATKDNVAYTVVGLSGASSVPDFKSMGAGVYKLYLYATSTGSTHWQSASPLVVTVNSTYVPPTPPIECNPRINGSLTSLTLTSSSPNPLIAANCNPTNVQYSWTVTKNGLSVNVLDLIGANSNPNFLALGKGTYLISLKASALNYLPWNTTTPLTITVDDAPAYSTVSCAPRLNNNAVSLVIPLNGVNPLVTSGCTPATAVPVWKVMKDNKEVTIAGLTGVSSTGQFIQAGLGTYKIYLTATAAGYNAYVSAAPLDVTIAEVPKTYRDIKYEKKVTASDNKVDVLLVIDDSNSMLADNAKLSQKLEGFVNNLTTSGLDWQMCATVTRWQDDNTAQIPYWGLSRKWINYIGTPQWVLNAGAINPYPIFTDTVTAIGAGWANSDDERGIKAAWYHAEYAKYNYCYRPDASVAVILISDEDERSIGGNQSQIYYDGEYKTLEADDYPQSYITKIKQEFGENKRFTVNSIIVKPGDTACMAQQDAGGAKSHYGYKYQELSQLTGGAVGSICDTDYSQNLYYFKDKIVNTLASLPLECAPVGQVTVTVTPTMGTFTTSLVNNTIVFNPAVPVGRTINLEYKCSTN